MNRFASLAIPVLAVLTGAQAAVSDRPAGIIGTYNVSFLMGSVPKAFVQSLLPAAYNNSLITPNSSVFPGLASDSHPIVFELGREANAGPPGLANSNFQEAKIEVPFVSRVSTSPNTPFLYKRLIMVDDPTDVSGSSFFFGLNTTLNTFVPSNSSNSSSFDYEVTGVLKATLETTSQGVIPLETFQTTAGFPWFAQYSNCAQHIYNFTAPMQRVSGVVALAQGLNIAVEGVHTVVPFKIVGPLSCDTFL